MNPVMIVLLYIFSSLAIGLLGRKYRFGFWGYFFASLLLTPAIGSLLILASIPQKPPKKNGSTEHQVC